MDPSSLTNRFSHLSTPLVADACLRLGLPLRLAPPGLQPLKPGSFVVGRVLPAKHAGSVDIFLEAIESAEIGDILVIDNQGRLDEGCIGDLTVLEAQASGLAGLIVWGCHRDTTELVQIDVPVFSYGRCPAGPTRLDPRVPDALQVAQLGAVQVGREDFVFADDDGAVFVPKASVETVTTVAEQIWETERRQAAAIKAGQTLRQQFQFRDYLAKRAADSSYSFRQHLRVLGGAIEE